jgi:hypothetical protein
MSLDSEAQTAVESLARAIVGETAAEDQPEAAREVQLEAARALAVAQLELTRIRDAKVAATPRRLEQMLDPAGLEEPVRNRPLRAAGAEPAQGRQTAAGRDRRRPWMTPIRDLETETGSDTSAAQAGKRLIRTA